MAGQGKDFFNTESPLLLVPLQLMGSGTDASSPISPLTVNVPETWMSEYLQARIGRCYRTDLFCL